MPITLELSEKEGFNEITGEIIIAKPIILELEHSLISLSKWEAKWKKPFIKMSEERQLSREENIDYFKFMSIRPIKDLTPLNMLSASEEQKILAYISDPMSATTFNDKVPEGQAKKRRRKEIITSEIIYYWMVELGIPFECEKWHLNRLLTLVRVCQEKQTVPKKMKKKDVLGMYAAENAARRARLGTKG